MRVAIYARVSTADQSPERQIRELRSYLRARDWKIVREAQEVSPGKGSGKRPALDDILHMERCRQEDAIFVQALDRWIGAHRYGPHHGGTRSSRSGFCRAGTQRYDHVHGSNAGPLPGGSSRFERELTRERVRSGLANAKAKGKPLGCPRASSSRVQKGLLLLDQGKTYREAAQQTGSSVSTLLRARREKKKSIEA